MTRSLTIIAAGGSTTVQDLGRSGRAHLGVPPSGAADRGAFALANRLVGNVIGAAVIEMTMGALAFTANAEVFVVVTGAPAQVHRDGTPMGHCAGFAVPAGSSITVDPPTSGVRSYLAVRGGIGVQPVLGSRSTDTLSGLGPPAVTAGVVLPIGDDAGAWPAVTVAPPTPPPALHAPVSLRCEPGPRADALLDPAALTAGRWLVAAASDRIGVRLDPAPGSTVPRLRPGSDTVASEGIALGSVQMPPGGQPVIFLADHPVTGGYPVVAVLTARSLDLAAQLRPGTEVRLHT
ncbi:biotin-dependent carboxyltransferase family protein [Williamsia sp. CHRR-6]|nr:biotin-dependent carboxyltransferase family protein [Williamsia sp. CHRR-6]